MRRALLAVLSVAVLLGSVAGARTAEEDVKAILARAIKAHGGEEALNKYKATRAKSKGKIKLPMVGEVDFTQEVATLQPDKFKESLSLEVAGNTIQVVTVVNGEKASIEANGMAVPINDDVKKALKDARYLMKTSRLASLLKDKSYEFAALGEIKVEGKPAVGVRVSSKGNKDINLYFDKETGLVAKVEHRALEPMSGKEFTEERIVLDYQKGKEGLQQAKKVLIKHNGEKFMEAEITEMTLLETLDDSEFAVGK